MEKETDMKEDRERYGKRVRKTSELERGCRGGNVWGNCFLIFVRAC